MNEPGPATDRTHEGPHPDSRAVFPRIGRAFARLSRPQRGRYRRSMMTTVPRRR